MAEVNVPALFDSLGQKFIGLRLQLVHKVLQQTLNLFLAIPKNLKTGRN